MGKRTLFFIFILSLLFTPVIGMDAAFSRSMLVTDADNDVCPVTKEKITVKKFNTTYNGKRYWFNSYSAVREFKSNPEKYLRNLNESRASTPRREEEVKESASSRQATEEKETTRKRKSWW